MIDGQGSRNSAGKVRFDLLHPIGTLGIARVMTKGAKIYDERNWERGMPWGKCIASAYRHLQAVMRGEDYDIDPNCEDCKKGTPGGDINDWYCTKHTGELHIDCLQTNAHFLSTYYKIFPQGDDRRRKYLNMPKIGLDLDDTIVDFVPAFIDRFKLKMPINWFWSYDTKKYFEELKDDKDFWVNLPAKVKASDLGFEPHCYITSRNFPVEWSMEWLDRNQFSTAPIHQLGHNASKVEVAKASGLNIFVDDRFEHFRDLNNAGVCTFLMDAPWNQRYNVGFKRIKHLNDLIK